MTTFTAERPWFLPRSLPHSGIAGDWWLLARLMIIIPSASLVYGILEHIIMVHAYEYLLMVLLFTTVGINIGNLSVAVDGLGQGGRHQYPTKH